MNWNRRVGGEPMLRAGVREAPLSTREQLSCRGQESPPWCLRSSLRSPSRCLTGHRVTRPQVDPAWRKVPGLTLGKTSDSVGHVQALGNRPPQEKSPTGVAESPTLRQWVKSATHVEARFEPDADAGSMPATSTNEYALAVEGNGRLG